MIICKGFSPARAVSQDGNVQRQTAVRLANEAGITTDHHINLLREQIRSGAYQLDPATIASAMLQRNKCLVRGDSVAAN